MTKFALDTHSAEKWRCPTWTPPCWGICLSNKCLPRTRTHAPPSDGRNSAGSWGGNIPTHHTHRAERCRNRPLLGNRMSLRLVPALPLARRPGTRAGPSQEALLAAAMLFPGGAWSCSIQVLAQLPAFSPRLQTRSRDKDSALLPRNPRVQPSAGYLRDTQWVLLESAGPESMILLSGWSWQLTALPYSFFTSWAASCINKELLRGFFSLKGRVGTWGEMGGEEGTKDKDSPPDNFLADMTSFL